MKRRREGTQLEKEPREERERKEEENQLRWFKRGGGMGRKKM